jgi:hypothetical protein
MFGGCCFITVMTHLFRSKNSTDFKDVQTYADKKCGGLLLPFRGFEITVVAG